MSECARFFKIIVSYVSDSSSYLFQFKIHLLLVVGARDSYFSSLIGVVPLPRAFVYNRAGVRIV